MHGPEYFNQRVLCNFNITGSYLDSEDFYLPFTKPNSQSYGHYVAPYKSPQVLRKLTWNEQETKSSRSSITSSGSSH